MGTLDTMATDDVLDRVLGSNAAMLDVREAMARANEAAWRATEPRTLELSRLLVALLLHCDAEHHARTPGVDVDDSVVAELPRWPTSPVFTDAERRGVGLHGAVRDRCGLAQRSNRGSVAGTRWR